MYLIRSPPEAVLEGALCVGGAAEVDIESAGVSGDLYHNAALIHSSARGGSLCVPEVDIEVCVWRDDRHLPHVLDHVLRAAAGSQPTPGGSIVQRASCNSSRQL